jgi:hypothetical protein
MQDWQVYQYRMIPIVTALEALEEYLKKKEKKNDQKIGTMMKEYLLKKEKEGKSKESKTFEDIELPEGFHPAMLQNTLNVGLRFGFLIETNKKYDRLRTLKLAIEVVFPIALSLFAIGSSIWAGFFR